MGGEGSKKIPFTYVRPLREWLRVWNLSLSLVSRHFMNVASLHDGSQTGKQKLQGLRPSPQTVTTISAPVYWSKQVIRSSQIQVKRNRLHLFFFFFFFRLHFLMGEMTGVEKDGKNSWLLSLKTIYHKPSGWLFT